MSTCRPQWMAQATRFNNHFLTEAPVEALLSRSSAATPLKYDVHAALEVGVVLAAGQERHLEGCSFSGEVGDVWLYAMWEPHGSRAIGAGAESLIFAFLPAFLGDEMIGAVHWLALFSVPPNKRPRVTTPEMRQRVLALAVELREEVEGPSTPVGPDWFGAYLVRLFTLLYRGWEYAEEARTVAPAGSSEIARVMPAVTELHAHPELPLSVAQAAALCSLSVTHFQRLFTHAMGVSFCHFRLRARLAFAANSLLTSELSVDDVARASGFADGSHLHRHFLKCYKTTPARYRRQRG